MKQDFTCCGTRHSTGSWLGQSSRRSVLFHCVTNCTYHRFLPPHIFFAAENNISALGF